jgi:hypothetical protein
MGNWPNDADGDVFRALEADGVDLSKAYAIEFYVDFEDWPPADEALDVLKGTFGDVALQDDEEDEIPCLRCKIVGPLSYEFVTETQAKITEAVKAFGGYCADWGVQI